jgi:type IV fimbrial biogenesis protein FimT
MMHQPRIKKDETGFTLMEVIVTCAIIGIIAAIAIPSFSSLLPRYRLRLASQELLSNFQLAKITAIKRNTNCTISFSLPPAFNKYFNDGSGNYEYAVFIDSNRDLEYDAGEQVIAKKKWTDYNNDVKFDTTQGGGDGVTFLSNNFGLPSISFRSNGLPVNKNGIPSGGTVFLTNTNNSRTMQINLTTAGGVTITTN